MRIERVVTNETCNQNCWFCNARRPAERPEFIARRAVRERIAAARAGDSREIVLSGGEPTMRNDLVDLVQWAAEGGRRVVRGRREMNAHVCGEAGRAPERVGPKNSVRTDSSELNSARGQS